MDVIPSMLLRGVDYPRLYKRIINGEFEPHLISDKLFTSSESISKKILSHDCNDQNYILKTNDNCNLFITNIFPDQERICMGCGHSNLETENPTYLVNNAKYLLDGGISFQGYVPHYSLNCALYTCINSADIDPNFTVYLRMIHRMIYPSKKTLKSCTELNPEETPDFYFSIPGVKIEKNTISWAQTQK